MALPSRRSSLAMATALAALFAGSWAWAQEASDADAGPPGSAADVDGASAHPRFFPPEYHQLQWRPLDTPEDAVDTPSLSISLVEAIQSRNRVERNGANGLVPSLSRG
ncbi:hypothetical protein HOK31_28080, partial [Candidatus Poribacteria bacterium]|nr:hypothetical protein [Candidatus Poribacteria bacterium]